ncbi:lecithin retinol acyltransferase family protein [Gloeothece verrucosa]|uniref:NC domain protein n=1 Tax=Gloeothece verrucosa (strain PCC 7822) TaxID=497965 RepID=E0U931_GLOV7|nr:lecithin retinol acyltransferase family protein [Gloeothece verrucosa]ADN16170.1 NC domain protein [Gloeothece verrucosa PCC 7822]
MGKNGFYLNPGDHIYYPCGFHFHHGIYCGDIYYQNRHYKNIVIHFESKSKRGQIAKVPYEKFSRHQKIYVVQYKEGTCYKPDQVIERAINKLGEPNYNLFGNNCEHFAHWCKTGKKISAQVNQAVDVAARLGVGLLGGLATSILLPIAIPETLEISLVMATGYAGVHLGKSLTQIFMDLPDYQKI